MDILKEEINLIKKNWKGIIDSATNNLNISNVISSGSIHLDKALGIGGFPLGRIVEIYGNESSGKTTIALQLIKQAQENDKKALFIDVEHALDINYIKSIGIDPNKLLIANPTSGEQVFNIIEEFVTNKIVDVIIIDSVAAMIPECEVEANISDQQMGAHARLMSKGLRKIQSLLINNNECLIVFLNQIREKIGVFFGNPETTTGGKALKFFSSIRLETKKVDLIKDSTNNKIGIKTKVTVVKNKLAAPFNSANINIYFNNGYDYKNEIIDYAIEKNIITRNGSWYSFKETKLTQGKEQLLKFINENNDLYEEIKNITITNI